MMKADGKRQWMLQAQQGAPNAFEDRDRSPETLLSVGFILLPEFTLMAFSGFIEALRHAADEWDRSRQIRCRWALLSHDMTPIKASCGLEVLPWETLRDPAEFDYIVVVGGLTRAHSQIHPAIDAYLKKAARENVTLVALCTGSFALARAGLLNGRRCCVHWFHMTEFEAQFTKVKAESDKLFIMDGNRITCAGGGGAVDLAILLIEQHLGRATMLKCINQMVVDEVRRHNHPQSRLGRQDFAHIRNPLVRRAILMLEHHIGDAIPVSRIARDLGTSTRILERAFVSELGKPPARFARELRLAYGRWLLEHSTKSVTEIAQECSFTDASHFGRCFRRMFGQSPRSVRARSA